MSQLDIFIINYHCALETVRTIQRIAPKSDWRVWVIDNSDSQAEWERLEQHARALHGFPMHIEKAHSNLGFAKAINALFAQSAAPYCLLINPDAQIDASAIEQLLTDLETHPSHAAIAPVMRWLPNESWWIPSAQSQAWWHGIGLRVMGLSPAFFMTMWQRYYRDQMQIARAQKFISQSFVSGAILLIRRSAIKALGLPQGAMLDDRFFMYFEDADLSLRLRKAGFQIGIEPRAVGSHTYQHTAHKNTLMQKSHDQFARTWFPRALRKPLLQLLHRAPPEYLRAASQARPNSPAALENALGNDRLIAFSPSPWRMPAIWRDSESIDKPGLSEQAWDALSPGIYYGMCAKKTPSQTHYWRISFEKVDTAH